jgi:hypothetical protein
MKRASDVEMPGSMGGFELAKWLRSANPEHCPNRMSRVLPSSAFAASGAAYRKEAAMGDRADACERQHVLTSRAWQRGPE